MNLRFRHWIEKSNEYAYFGFEKYRGYLGGYNADQTVYYHPCVDACIDGPPVKIEKFTWDPELIQQSTGCKATNGDEIYEGDLVQWFDTMNRGLEVKFIDGGWAVSHPEGGYSWLHPIAYWSQPEHDHLWAPYHLTITGHIHES